MHMVRPDYLTAYADVEVPLGTLGKKEECCRNLVARQNGLRWWVQKVTK